MFFECDKKESEFITPEDICAAQELGNLIDELIAELESQSHPENDVWNVFFNEKKGVTCVVWKDGMKTIVKCQPGDTFSKETGVAMCFMKRYFNNSSRFNEVLKKYCYD